MKLRGWHSNNEEDSLISSAARHSVACKTATRNLRAGSWRKFQSQRRREPGIMQQNNWILRYNREILGHSPSGCYTQSFMDLQFRSHQIIPDLSVHRTLHDVCFFASHRRPFLAPATFTTFTTALLALKQTPIKRYNYSLSQQSIWRLRFSRMWRSAVLPTFRKDESSAILLNVCNYLSGYMSSHPRI